MPNLWKTHNFPIKSAPVNLKAEIHELAAPKSATYIRIPTQSRWPCLRLSDSDCSEWLSCFSGHFNNAPVSFQENWQENSDSRITRKKLLNVKFAEHGPRIKNIKRTSTNVLPPQIAPPTPPAANCNVFLLRFGRTVLSSFPFMENVFRNVYFLRDFQPSTTACSTTCFTAWGKKPASDLFFLVRYKALLNCCSYIMWRGFMRTARTCYLVCVYFWLLWSRRWSEIIGFALLLLHSKVVVAPIASGPRWCTGCFKTPINCWR